MNLVCVAFLLCFRHKIRDSVNFLNWKSIKVLWELFYYHHHPHYNRLILRLWGNIFDDSNANCVNCAGVMEALAWETSNKSLLAQAEKFTKKLCILAISKRLFPLWYRLWKELQCICFMLAKHWHVQKVSCYPFDNSFKRNWNNILAEQRIAQLLRHNLIIVVIGTTSSHPSNDSIDSLDHPRNAHHFPCDQ